MWIILFIVVLEESKPKAQGLAQELNADNWKQRNSKSLERCSNGALEYNNRPKKAMFTALPFFRMYEAAKAYRNYIKRRFKYIASALRKPDSWLKYNKEP